MNISLILRRWHEKLDSLSRENLWIKSSLHGVARSEQGEPIQLPRFRRCTSCFYDTDQWNWRLGRDVVENDVRRVCRDQAESCAGSRELADFLNYVIRHPGEIVCLHEIESLFQINAVNDELRVTAILRSPPVKRDDPRVIINRAFGTEAANDSESLHVLTTNPPSLKLRRDMWTRINTNSSNGEMRVARSKE